MSVLVVEDDTLLLLELEAVLQDAGAAAIALCRSVDEAMTFLDDSEPDVAILDFSLRAENASPIARRLLRNGTPFIFYTGQVTSDPRFAEWADRKIVQKPAPSTAIVDALLDELIH